MSIVSRSPADRVIVVGAGVAGLATALRLAPRPVTIVTAAPLGNGTATGWAQGGIAASIGPDDAPSLHAADTEAAGAGLTEPDVALHVAGAAPALIDWLVGLGVAFDRDADGSLALGLEAAHSRRRIVRGRGDSTGATVLEGLVRAVRATPSIEVLVAEAKALMQDANGAVRGLVCASDGAAFRLPARAVVLATGGVGGLYAATTNPRGAIGSGLLLAARAGATLRDLEFVQFHPTAIAAGADPMPLATEALRGEGAVLVDGAGERVMAGISGGDLAPRDVVARGIFQALSGGRDVFLDARGDLGRSMTRRFPTVAGLCAGVGIDPALQPIPVRPAAHYHMGGVLVDAGGRTDVPGLWACGEVASTGLHGANRLASNSLLEALAFAGPIAASIEGVSASAMFGDAASAPRRQGDDGRALAEVRALMDRRVGVVRDEAGLREAIARLHVLAEGGSDAALTGLMIAVCALSRQESRGAHWRSDFSGQAARYHTATTLAEVLRVAAERAGARERVSSEAVSG
ncbi:L-aspartate oxidase [Methylobacterium haplocladii]|uniref:L-aspartate oxidase n=2 Tax=Methylobacterium haplocladii TaxID=1176176 RepID=A0A512IPY4_9HYPH|nr:L-aspartate oxidase [Methylobacterium haplocladii]GEO99767.1 L-aspartate oxidase [Methylobacterium haplocladii]GJD84601.1 L-aspartate oxidase [Methylobacterium haplocladii]